MARHFLVQGVQARTPKPKSGSKPIMPTVSSNFSIKTVQGFGTDKERKKLSPLDIVENWINSKVLWKKNAKIQE